MIIDYGTGITEEVNGTLEEAMKVAEKGMTYTQESVTIKDNGNVIAKSQWISVKATEEDDVLADFNDFGFYRNWEFN